MGVWPASRVRFCSGTSRSARESFRGALPFLPCVEAVSWSDLGCEGEDLVEGEATLATTSECNAVDLSMMRSRSLSTISPGTGTLGWAGKSADLGDKAASNDDRSPNPGMLPDSVGDFPSS